MNEVSRIGRLVRAAAAAERRGAKLGILPENCLLQPAQFGGRVQAEVLGKRLADPVIYGQRVSLPAAPVQGQHQLTVRPLAQRLLRNDGLQFGDHVRVAARGQFQLDTFLRCGEAELGQPVGLAQGPLPLGELRQRFASPQPQRPRVRLGRPS